MTPGIQILALAAVVLLYYRVGKGLLFAGAGRLAPRVAAGRNLDSSEVSGVLELGFAAASHLMLVAVLLAVTGLSPGRLGAGLGQPGVLAMGVLLGAGQVGLSSLLCRVVVEVGSARDRPGRHERVRAWLGRSRGGWIRHHLRTLQVLPLPAAVGLTGLQVACEEIVFRMIIIDWLRDYGPLLAVGTSLVLFVAMQVFFMSTWRAALFPTVGALVMGLTHGILYWHYPVIAPLVLAHVCFFLFAVL